uniref:Cation:proton antiporter n=1 Tax=Ignisphaera aggregans TaxID=334771 RepID=A0A7C2Z8S8_9CREN
MAPTETWLLEIAVLILIAKFLEGMSKRIRLPQVVFLVAFGVILSVFRYSTGLELSSVIEALATLGIVLQLFMAGLEGSLRLLIWGFRAAGLIAFGGIAGSLAFGVIASSILGLDLIQGFALGVVFSATSVSVTVSVFEELGMVDSKEAMYIIEAAVIDDVAGLVLLSFLYTTKSAANLLYISLIPFAAFAIWFGTAFLTSRYADDLLKEISRLGATRGIEVVAIAILFLLAFIAQELGLASILLAYAYGVGLASHRHFAKRIAGSSEILVAIFAPLFFITVGYNLDISYLMTVSVATVICVSALITVFGFLSKIVGCYISSRALKLDHKSSLIIGVGMTPRSEVAMIAATTAYSLGLIDTTVYVACIVMVLVSVIISPIILRRLVESIE